MATSTQKQLIGIAITVAAAAGLALLSKSKAQPVGTVNISDLTVTPEISFVGSPVTISIIATNVDSPENTHEFVFNVNGKDIKATAFIQAGETVAVAINYTPMAVGDYIVTIDDLYATFAATEPPAEIGFTVQVINCPITHRTGAIAKFNDGTGNWVPCGEVGIWPQDANIKQPFPFSIYVYEWVDDTMWDRLGFYSFAAITKNGKDYIFDCSNGEFSEA